MPDEPKSSGGDGHQEWQGPQGGALKEDRQNAQGPSIENLKPPIVRALPLSSMSPAVAGELKEKLAKAHYWDGATAFDGSLPVLAMRVYPESRGNALSITKGSSVYLPYCWNSDFGPVVTITVFPTDATAKYPLSRISLFADDPIIPHLARLRGRFAFYEGERLVAYNESDLTPAREFFAAALQTLMARNEAPLPCKEAAFWYALGELSDANLYGPYLRPGDKLSLGWMDELSWLVQAFGHERKQLKLSPTWCQPPGLSVRAAEMIETWARAKFSLESLVEVLRRSLQASFRDYKSTQLSITEIYEKAPELNRRFMYGFANAIAWLHPQMTACGLYVPWICGDDPAFAKLRLEPDKFPSWFDPRKYWEYFPHPQPSFFFGHVISGEDVPMELTPAADAWKKLPRAESAAESTDLADRLFEEAVRLKRWTIPPKALVELPYGPFSHFELTEFDPNVLATGRTPRGEFVTFVLEPSDNYFRCDALTSFKDVDPEGAERVLAAIRQCLAAVIRDFWVVEEREHVFGLKSAKRVAGIRIPKEPDGTPRIVYLPRVHYKETPNTKRCAEHLEHAERAAHDVRGHLRRAASASAKQKKLAASFGYPSLPEGYTFVRAHRRGEHEREIVYRSRSALQSLYRVDDSKPAGKVDWFQFERDVAALMKNEGFEVQHWSASKSGDQGIDVYATKGEDLDLMFWVIQCKCYSPHRHVGPEKVRELLGVLSMQPPGTRGMIVTASTFTSGARELAVDQGIRLMDGIEFARRAGKQPGK